MSRKVAEKLSYSLGCKITFETGIIPKWRSRRLRLHNVHIHRHASHFSPDSENARWAFINLRVDTIDVSINLLRYLQGKGLIEDVVVNGVRGEFGTRRHFDGLG